MQGVERGRALERCNDSSSPSHSMWHHKSTDASRGYDFESLDELICDTGEKHLSCYWSPLQSQLDEGFLQDWEGVP